MEGHYYYLSVILLLIIEECSGLSVTPSADQFLAVSSPLSVTFTCNASQDELNSVGTIVMWEVDGMRFDTTATPFVGVFVEEVALGVLNLTVTGAAGVQFEDSGLRLACLSMTTSFSPAISSLAPLYVRFFGRPDPPGNLDLPDPYSVAWDRPMNIPEEVPVTYTLTINSSDPRVTFGSFGVRDRTRLSIPLLGDFLATGQCVVVMLYLVASVPGAEDSEPAFLARDALSSTIDNSLRVDSVTFTPNGNFTASISFQAAGLCSRNYTLLVRAFEVITPPSNFEVPISLATPTSDTTVTVTLRSLDFPSLLSPPNSLFLVNMEFCSDVMRCTLSSRVSLYTSDVQSARAVFFGRHVSYTCSFANGSLAIGCEFRTEGGLPPILDEAEVTISQRSLEGQLCRAIGYEHADVTDLSVSDIEQDGNSSRSSLLLIVDVVVVEDESVFTNMTGCEIHEVSLQADAPTCPEQQVSFTCVSLPSSIDQFFWFYERNELVSFESRARPMSIISGRTEFFVLSPSPGISVITFNATADINGKALQCGSSSTSGSIGSSNAITLQVADLGPPQDLVQQILTPGVGQSMVFIEWRPLLNAEGIGYSVEVSTPTDKNFLNLVSDDPSFNFTASHNVEYLVSVAANIRCSGVRPAPLLFELVGCPRLLMFFPIIIFPMRSNLVGSTINFGCEDGFRPEGPPVGNIMVGECGSDGQWIPDPESLTCILACDESELPFDENSMAISNTATIVMFHCLPGFSPSEPVTFICLTTGQWNPSPSLVQCTRDSFTDGFNVTTVAADSSSGVDTSLIIGIVLAIALVIVAVLVILLLVIYIGVRRRKMMKTREIGQSKNEADNTNMELFHVQLNMKFNLPKNLKVSSSQLTLGRTVGQGEFGVVYRAKLKRGSVASTVAVKTLRGFVDQSNVDDLLKECIRMSEFDHPNVLTLTGVCLDGGPAPYIIMPFMENGSLLSYLIKERESLVLEPGATENVEPQTRKLLDICVQVAKGMEYLASKRVVHRDLAARNCMIDYNLVIKVADFGLSETIDTSKQYFRQDKQVVVRLPIKWLAPESINDGVFSEASDVWSYGVTCWEIFSGGKTPYPGIHPVDMPYLLDKGQRLEKPLNEACTDIVFSVMQRCWEKCQFRPTFADLVTDYSSQLQGLAGYLDLSTAPTSQLQQTEYNDYHVASAC